MILEAYQNWNQNLLFQYHHYMNIFINDKYNDIKTTHYCSIDLLRGLSAIIILIFHYKHFFLKDNIPLEHDLYADNFPLYGLLSLFYNHVNILIKIVVTKILTQ